MNSWLGDCLFKKNEETTSVFFSVESFGRSTGDKMEFTSTAVNPVNPPVDQ
jgi:hypothetical protein